MHCPSCGKEISFKNKYCDYCSVRITIKGRLESIKQRILSVNTADIKKKIKKMSKKQLMTISGRAAAAILVIIILFSIGRGGKSYDTPSSGRTVAAAESAEPAGHSEDRPNASPSGAPEPVASGGNETVSAEDDYTKTQEYQEAYRITWNAMPGIIANYWEDGDGIDRALRDLQGSTEKFYEAIKALDPNLYDYAAETIASENADTPLEYHLIEQGVSTVLGDNELGRELRNIGERVFLSFLEELLRYGDSLNRDSDLLIAIAVNDYYALMRTKGTVSSLLEKLDTDSGYSLIGPALEDYRQKLEPVWAELFQETMESIDTGNAEQRAAVDAIGYTLHGIGAALDDYEALWNRERNAWIDSFFAEFDMQAKNVTSDDCEKYIYCVIDRSGRSYARFLWSPVQEGGSAFAWIGSDGSVYLRDYEGAFQYKNLAGKTIFSGDNLTLISDTWGDKIGSKGDYVFTGTKHFLRMKAENDFNHGDYFILELVQADGSAKELLRGTGYPEEIYDYYLPHQTNRWFSSVNGTGVWLVKYVPLGERKAVSVIVELDSGDVTPESKWVSEHSKEQLYDKGFIRLNEDYVYVEKTWNIYSDSQLEYDKEQGCYIIPKAAEPAVTLSAGNGVNSIFYNKDTGRYWVLSGTGYYYVLDGSFSPLYDPVRLENEQSLYEFTPYGVLLRTSGGLALFDEEGRQMMQFPANYVYGFIGGTLHREWGYYINPNKSDYDMSYNLNTHERMYYSFGRATAAT